MSDEVLDKDRRERDALHARVRDLEPADLEALQKEIERRLEPGPGRWNPNPDDVHRAVVRLVLTLVEFIRELLERQAIRRMEGETLSEEEVERVGLALMKLEETVAELAAQFDLAPEDLQLNIGSLRLR